MVVVTNPLKVLDLDRLNQLLYTEPPVCPRSLEKAMQDSMNAALAGSPEHVQRIALCLTFAGAGNEPESVQKFFFIVCTGRLPKI